MALSLLCDFLDGFKDKEETAEAEVEKLCEELKSTPDNVQVPVAEITVPPTTTKDEEWGEEDVKVVPQAAPPADPVDPPGPTDIGVLTEVGKVPIIDDEHSVRMDLQRLSADQFVKGRRVRYSYVEKDDMRKNIVILECLVAQPEVVKATPVAAPKEVKFSEPPRFPKETPVPSPSIITTTPGPALDPGLSQWKGQVKVVRSVEDLTAVEVHFDNGSVQVIILNEKNCDPDYRPVPDDTVVVYCTTEPSDEDDEEDELVAVEKILPANQFSSGGTITFVYDEYAVVDEDIWLNEVKEGYEVGVYLEYTCVPCKKDEFKWRCLTAEKAEKPERQDSNTNREFLDNPENYVDRRGLSIANRDELSFRFYTVDQEAEKKIVIANTGSTPYRLLNLYFHSDKSRPQIRLKSYWKPTIINPRSQIEVRIHAKARFICNYEESAIALFNHDMVLVTRVKIAVGSDELVRTANVRDRAYRANRMRAEPEKPEQPATQVFRASRTTRKFVVNRIGGYPIPALIWELMCLTPAEFEEKCAVEFPFLAEPLSGFNYKERLHQMVYISEAYLKKCFRIYEIQDQRFEKEGEFYCLRLENLAESRPSVLQEDTVVAREGSSEFTGIIKRILMDRVLFEFHEEFNEAHREKRYNVTFRYNRPPFQKLHHALDEMAKKFGEEFLFPDTVEEKAPLLDMSYDCAEDETDLKQLQKPMELRLPNGDVKAVPWQNKDLNWHQKRAIVNALRGECRPLPHLICGPPGTGKTSTLVELMLQQFLNNNQSHILVCTPSNSAANLILEKLIASDQLLNDHFMRVIGFQAKEKEMIPEDLLPYCGTVEKSKEGTEGREMSVLENGFRENCQMEYLSDFRIIILTIGSVGTFMEMGFPERHFTHLYVDEAGQCLETEIIVPMTLLSKMNGHFVFVGDEKQLGPVVQFNPLVRWNYGLSLFERLQQFPMYNRADSEHYDSRLCYQLVNNYRSLPTILKLYNTLFYNDTLQPMVSYPLVSRPLTIPLTLISPSFPFRSWTTRRSSTIVCERCTHCLRRNSSARGMLRFSSGR